MPLRGRVGRHVKTGAHCQNWKGDQEVVIALLNRIPVADGGAGGSLAGRVIGGLASETLFQAILRFEKQHSPGNQTGFVEPGGAVLARMEMLASRPPTAPAPTPPRQWDALTTGSVKRALREGLDDDMKLSHAEVVNIVRSTLSDGIVSANEVNDLVTVSTTSKSIPPRSRKMLDTFVDKIRKTSGGKGPYNLPSDKHKFAAGMVCDFLERSGASRFPRLDREEVGVGMLMRIANPGIMKQEESSLCGPAALLFNVVSDNPVAYARFAIDLYEKGKASLYRLEIEPDEDVRNYRPVATKDYAAMDHVDWMTMASIRDSENWFLDYDTAEKETAGMTLPGELSHWFRRAGYSDVREETNLVANKGTGTIDDANRLFGQGYRVCLFIGINMLNEKHQSEGSLTAEHWVVQRSPIDRSNGKVRLQVFSWGEGAYQIPPGSKDLSVGDFLDNFYGYVAGKP